MDLKIVSEIRRADYEKKCNALTCVHYAGGFCVGCDGEGECEFIERAYTQD